jgi:hypothetical protein
MCVSPIGTPPASFSDEAELLDYIDLLYGEDLAQFAFTGSDREAKQYLIDKEQTLLIRRDFADSAALKIFVRLDVNEFKEFIYKISFTSDPAAESGFQIKGPVL